ncbi:MAG: TolC family protein [Bacteroidota bacterium]|jgi:outer membrane protein TolC
MKTKLNFLWFLMVLPGLYGNAALAERPAAVRKLTFDQALDLTYQNSHVLKQVSYLQKQKDQERLAAKGLFFPTIGVTASAIMMSDPIELDLNPIKDAITPLYKTLGSYGKFGDVPGLTDDMATQVIRQKLNAGLGQIQNEDWNQVIQKQQFAVVAATLQWPVFTGGKILIANKSAEIQKKDVHDVFRQKEGELMSELVERYYGLCLASSVVKIRTEVRMGLQKHLEDAVKLENQGIISNADLLQARVYSAQAGRELSKAIRNTSIVTQALMSTMVLEDSSMVEPVSALFYLDTIEPQTYFSNLAQATNPILKQIETKKLLAEQKYKAEKSEFYPSVALQGTYDIVNKDLSTYIPDWEVGIGLKWTIFDGVSRIGKVKAASMQTKQVEEFGMKAQADISTNINKLYNELNMHREQLTELETAARYAEEYLRSREKEFIEETGNSTQVIDARLALAQVRTERLQAMYNYDLTLARLLEYSGIAGNFPSYAKRNSVKF